MRADGVRRPDVLAAAAVLVLGLAGLYGLGYAGWGSALAALLLTLGSAAAVAVHRTRPPAALGLVWACTALQLLAHLWFSPAQIGVLLVAYGCGRYGSRATLWASGVSIPLGALAVLSIVWSMRFSGFGDVLLVTRDYASSLTTAFSLLVLGFVLVTAVLAAPWGLGLVLRLRVRAERDERQRLTAERQRGLAEEEREQAEEIARLREDQTRLARDVHDVVGHSLAVILAQAESAQFRPETDSGAIRTTLADIAVTARQSLRDVRDVLSSTDGTAAVAATSTGGLDALVDGVRVAGNDVRSRVVGVPRPLPPELDVVAFRVLQEMLTNALKHGRRGEPVLVERHWEGELRIEVCNVVAEPLGTEDTQPLHAATAGRGLEGMRQRLESVGGRLDVRRREESGDTGGVAGPAQLSATFTATAWIPLRAGG